MTKSEIPNPNPNLPSEVKGFEEFCVGYENSFHTNVRWWVIGEIGILGGFWHFLVIFSGENLPVCMQYSMSRMLL